MRKKINPMVTSVEGVDDVDFKSGKILYKIRVNCDDGSHVMMGPEGKNGWDTDEERNAKQDELVDGFNKIAERKIRVLPKKGRAR